MPVTSLPSAAGIVGARLEADEQGESRIVIVHTAAAAREAVHGTRASHRRQRAHAWGANPHCVQCGTRIPSADACAVVALDDGDRVACTEPCFALAIRQLIEALG